MKGSPKVYCERGVTIERIITIVQMGMGKYKRSAKKGGKEVRKMSLKSVLPSAVSIAICHGAACIMVLSALKGLRNNDSEK